MIKLIDILNEKTELSKGADKSIFAPIIKSAILYMNDKYNMNPKISLHKVNAKRIGGDLKYEPKGGKFKLRVNFDQQPNLIIGTVLHEMTHIHQRLSGKLKIDNDNKKIIWKGKPYISFNEYDRLGKKSFKDYKKLPWEAEAFHNQENLVNDFKSSKYYKKLRGLNPNLDIVLDY